MDSRLRGNDHKEREGQERTETADISHFMFS